MDFDAVVNKWVCFLFHFIEFLVSVLQSTQATVSVLEQVPQLRTGSEDLEAGDPAGPDVGLMR